jgi:hypothetical protein
MAEREGESVSLHTGVSFEVYKSMKIGEMGELKVCTNGGIFIVECDAHRKFCQGKAESSQSRKFCRATLIMSPGGDIRNVPFYGRYDNRNVP